MSVKVPFVDLARQFVRYEDELVEIFRSIGRTGKYILDKHVQAFETAAAQACGVREAIALADGTDALILALRAMGIGPGDDVITTPNSYIASAGAIAAVGANIRFVDVLDDLNMDPAAFDAAITPRVKAVMPVHLTGRPAKMDEIVKSARRNGIYVLEDAAQAIGAELHGRRVGGLGDAAGFSLHPLKNLHVHGDGGFATTNCPELAARMRRARNHGLKDRNHCLEWGLNSRLDEVNAAIATFKLERLDELNARHREIAQLYRDGLSDCVEVPVDSEGEWAVYHNFVIQLDRRDDLKAFLADKGVETNIHYPVLLHLQQAARGLGYREGDFPNAERIVDRMLSLPIYPEITAEEISAVISEIRAFCGKKTG